MNEQCRDANTHARVGAKPLKRYQPNNKWQITNLLIAKCWLKCNFTNCKHVLVLKRIIVS